MSIAFQLPGLGAKAQSGDVVSILVREGDSIAAGRIVAEVETDKAVVEVACPYAGKIVRVLVSKGQTVHIGQPILDIETASDHSTPLPQTPATPMTSDEKTSAASASISAEARRLAQELGVDLGRILGTGKSGRITVEDVRAAAKAAAEKSNEKPATEDPPNVGAGSPAQKGTREPAVPPGVLDQDAHGPVRRDRISDSRRAIAAQMAQSASNIPHVTYFDDADVTDLERMCKTIPSSYLGPTVKLNVLPFALKAVATALRQHPALNASLDEERGEIVYKQYINLGLTIDAPRGPIVPVMHGVDQMDVLQIARELTLLAVRTRSGNFSAEELAGGVFTVYNQGGAVYGTPIIRPPEAACLMLGRTRWVLGVHDGKAEGRMMLPLSLSCDSRIVDGGAAGLFMAAVIDYLQLPGKLLLTR